MKIDRPVISHTGGEMIIRYPVEIAGSNCSLWYSLDEQNAGLVEPGFEGPLAGLLMPAMAAGEDIWLAGEVCQKLVFSLQHQMQPLLKWMLPGLNGIQLHPECVRETHTRGQGIISGFSGGVDSFITLNDFFLSPEVEDHARLTHLAFFNVGSHGSGEGGVDMFHQRVAHLKNTTDALGLPLVTLQSNLSEFYQSGPFTFENTHTIRSASAALMLQQGFKRFHYSAGYTYPEVYIRPKMLMAHADPILLPALSTGAMELVSTGTEYSRVEKIRTLAEIPFTYEHLSVCLKSVRHCGKCRKCVRTMLILDLLGELHHYGNLFDLKDFYANRSTYLYSLFYYDNPFVREILHLAKHSARTPGYMKALMLLRGIRSRGRLRS